MEKSILRMLRKEEHTMTCGAVIVSGSSWLHGGGVDVRSNDTHTGTGQSCSPFIENLHANPPQWGYGWQCVELIERLYLTRHWIDTTWSAWPDGYAHSMYGHAPVYLSKEPQTHISRLAPGDVVVFATTFYPPFGHVAVIDAVNPSITMVSQNVSTNAAGSRWYASLGGGSLTVYSDAGKTHREAIGGQITGVVHAPPEANVVIDDGSPGFNRLTGSADTWSASNVAHGNHCWWTPTRSTATNSARWVPLLPSEGNWSVWAYVPRENATATRAHYQITYWVPTGPGTGDLQPAYQMVNQDAYSDAWASLGTWYFKAGSTGKVELTNATGEDPNRIRIAYDAVMFVKR
jgi:hypothetical protein